MGHSGSTILTPVLKVVPKHIQTKLGWRQLKTVSGYGGLNLVVSVLFVLYILFPVKTESFCPNMNTTMTTTYVHQKVQIFNVEIMIYFTEFD